MSEGRNETSTDVEIEGTRQRMGDVRLDEGFVDDRPWVTWISMNPVTGELCPYDEHNSRYLELAFKAMEPENPATQKLTLLLDLWDAGLVADVHFDPTGGGLHKQMTASGQGLRQVRRCEGPLPHVAPAFATAAATDEPPCVQTVAEGTELDKAWAVGFRRVAWVHLDPVNGAVAPYSKENAHKCEEALRMRANKKYITIDLPNGMTIDANVDVRANKDGIFSQCTRRGFREVRRLELQPNSFSCFVSVYRTPKDDSIDSERYRFGEDGGKNTYQNAQEVKYADGCFMMEEALPVSAFAEVTQLEKGLRQLATSEDCLTGLARRLKSQPYLIAAKCLQEAHREEQGRAGHTKPITDHLSKIIAAWTDAGYLKPYVPRPYAMEPTEDLLDDLAGAFSEQLLVSDGDSRMYGSNSTRIAAAAAHLMISGH